MIYGSVCSGIEAATVAWRPSGWRAAWYAEIDTFASAVLAHRFPEVRNLGDFTKIDARPPQEQLTLLVGGTPCQSFSVAGHRLGLDDPRGNLTLEFLRLAARARPRWVVWENVPGVLSIDGGRTFGTVLRTLAELGYGIAYRVLDAQFFGVPQRRRRVFVVGYLGGWQAAAAVLFERESLRRDLAPRRKAEEIVTAITANSLGTCGGDPKQAQAGHILPAAVVGHSVSAKWAKRGSGPSGSEYHNLVAPHARGRRASTRRRTAPARGVPRAVAFSCKDYGADASEDVAPTLRAMGHDASHPNAGGQLAVAFRGCGQEGFVPREVAPPIVSTDGGNTVPMVFEARFARNGRGAPDVVAPPPNPLKESLLVWSQSHPSTPSFALKGCWSICRAAAFVYGFAKGVSLYIATKSRHQRRKTGLTSAGRISLPSIVRRFRPTLKESWASPTPIRRLAQPQPMAHWFPRMEHLP